MEHNPLRRNIWDTAAKAGLVLGAVSTAYMFISQFLGTAQLSGFFGTLAGFVLWGAKFGGCIWLMMFFMKKFVAENAESDNSTSFRFGVATAILSAVIYAAFSFANTAYFSADMIAENMETVMQAYSQFMDANTMSRVDEMMSKMPQITFFSNLFYCSIFGTILSLILSRNIPSRNPFDEYKPDEQ